MTLSSTVITIRFADAKGMTKLGLHPLLVQDGTSKTLDYATIGQSVSIRSNVSAMNDQYIGIPFTIITEVRDRNDVTVYLDAADRIADVPFTEGHTSADFTWMPEEMGKHEVSVMVVSNLTSPEVLARRNIELTVLGQCNPPRCMVLGDDDAYRQNYRMIGSTREGPAKQQAFTGLFGYEPDNKCGGETLLRCTPYRLGNMSVYSGADNLDDYVGYYRIRDRPEPSFEWVNLDYFLGHQVEVIGKIYKYSIDGPVIEEIVPVRIRMID